MAAAPSACASATTCRPASRVWRRSSPLSEARGACGAPRQRRTASAARRARGRPGPNEEVLMDIAMVGLGRMGGNMARRLLRGGHRVVVWNRTFAKAEELGAEGAEPVRELAGVVAALPQPRVIWLMLPYGDTTQEAIDELVPLLAVDEDVVNGEQRHELVDRLLGGVAVGQHQPDDARLRQRGHDAGQFADGLGAFGAELLRLGEGAVPYHDSVTAAQQAPRHVAAHAAQADHGDVHQDLLVRTGPSARATCSRRGPALPRGAAGAPRFRQRR